jgi:hypothetical protein
MEFHFPHFALIHSSAWKGAFSEFGPLATHSYNPGRVAQQAAASVALACATVALLDALTTAPAVSAVSSDHGASFAVRCDFSHRASDDPIVYPGKPGASHSHDFFGNESTDAFSTYRSMIKKGRPKGTTCTRPLDTAAYWMPTLKWNGNTLDSNRAVFYYRAGGKDHKQVKPFPAGLKVVTAHGKEVSWRCGKRTTKERAPRRCSSGKLGVRIIFPDCSNGKLDGANHMAHMASSRPIDGKVRCPGTHPISVPVLTMNVTFRLPTNRGPVRLSSGHPSHMHADFFNAWNQKALKKLVSHCINNVSPARPRPPECRA